MSCDFRCAVAKSSTVAPSALILQEKEGAVGGAVMERDEVAATLEEEGIVGEATVKTSPGSTLLIPALCFCNTLDRYTWGNSEIERRAKADEKNAPKVEAKPVFELSGALARDTNKVNVGGGNIVVMKCVQLLSRAACYV